MTITDEELEKLGFYEVHESAVNKKLIYGRCNRFCIVDKGRLVAGIRGAIELIQMDRAPDADSGNTPPCNPEYYQKYEGAMRDLKTFIGEK